MKKKFIKLTEREIILGSQFCFENAKELFEEGELLFKNSKWARATSLFILGIEEISKVELLAQTFFYKSDEEWNSFEDNFTHHNSKLKLADSILLQLSYNSGDEERLKNELEDIMKGRNFNIGKQKCFYVGYSKNKGWEVPNKIATEEDAKYCQKVLGPMINIYDEIFSKSYDEIVDIVAQVKKTIPTDEIRDESLKMQNHIRNIANSFKTKT